MSYFVKQSYDTEYSTIVHKAREIMQTKIYRKEKNKYTWCRTIKLSDAIHLYSCVYVCLCIRNLEKFNINEKPKGGGTKCADLLIYKTPVTFLILNNFIINILHWDLNNWNSRLNNSLKEFFYLLYLFEKHLL